MLVPSAESADWIEYQSDTHELNSEEFVRIDLQTNFIVLQRIGYALCALRAHTI